MILRGLFSRVCPGPSLRSLLCLPEVATGFRSLHTSPPRLELLFLHKRPDLTAIKDDVVPAVFNSGDKETAPKIPPTRLRPGFERCRELADAHPDVVRLCSMEFGNGLERRHVMEMDLIKRVQRFASDLDSLEVRIARITAQIRTEQNHVRSGKEGRTHGFNTQLLVEAINRRKRYLRRLRDFDYNKFAWVLEQLNLEFANPSYAARTTRREIATGLVLKEAMEIRRDKFVKYHEILKSQQADFLVRKDKELAQMEEEERKLREELENLPDPEANATPFAKI